MNRNTLGCDYNRYSPSEISTINTANSRIFIKIPKEDSAISLSNSYSIQTLMYYTLLPILDM